MQRERKYRAYIQDYDDSELYTKDFTLSLLKFDYENGWELISNTEAPFCECYEDRKPYFFELVDYTGLKDKNGVEIYEGDICQDLGGSYCKIIWAQYDCSFWMEYVKYITDEVLTEPADYLEVVGNIYQNPELLK